MYMRSGSLRAHPRFATVKTFAVSPDLSHMRGLAGGHHAWFGDLGLAPRGFRAEVDALKAYGLEVPHHRQNVHQARYLASLVKVARLELMADVPLNIVCFGMPPLG
jgi:hypothetical protein